jgi:hypothetical protein
MSRRNKGSGSDRRDFLKLAGLGTLTGGAALLATGQAQAAVRDEDKKDDLYRVTEHVKTYYELARF